MSPFRLSTRARASILAGDPAHSRLGVLVTGSIVMRSPSLSRAVVLSALGCLSGLSAIAPSVLAQGVQFPGDANVVNVLSFGAVANDGGDDLAAFQAALNAVVGSSRVLYVPNGTYNFSGRMNWGGVGSGGFFTMQGQSQGGVILKLDDNAVGFDNPASPRAFVDAYEGNTANQFRNYLRDVTIDIGANNPGAIGLEFQANNTGRIENVTIRSSDAQKRGRIGLNQGFEFPGPMLIRNLTIDGFEEGYVGAPQEYSVVMENITLRNQRTLGIYVWRLPLQIRNLVSQNSVPVLRSHSNPGAWGHVVVDGATLTGGSPTGDAVINENSGGVLVLRNVTTSGYANAVRDESFSTTTPILVPGGTVAQFTTDAPASLNPSPTQILVLPIEDAPALPNPPLAQWASVKTFGAIENDNLDDTAAIQAAMNSGAAVVYFPCGVYYVSDTITIGPSVQRIEGFLSNLYINAPLTTENKPIFRVPPGSQNPLHIGGVQTSFSSPGQAGGGTLYEHATASTLVIRDGDISYRNTVAGGKVFLENVVGANMTFTGQRVWARQLNPEGSGGTFVTNDAGDFYVLGIKTEGDSIVLNNRNRARATIMGGLIYPSTAIVDRTKPIIINNESSLSFSLPESAYVDPNNAYVVWVRETRNGTTSDFTRAMLPLGRAHSPLGGQIALYNGYAVDSTPPSTPSTPTVASRTLSGYTLNWPASTDAESGVARYNVYRGGQFYRSTTTNALVESGLGDNTGFAYRVSAVNGSGVESSQSGVVSTTTLTDDTLPRLVAITTGLDARFVTLGFSEPISAASAAALASYTIAGPAPVSVVAAALSGDATSVTLTTSGMTPGPHTISISGLLDRATSPNAIASGTSASFVYSNTQSGTGLLAEYFTNRDLVGAPALTRIDPTVNFNYGFGSPDVLIPVDNFSVRWSGQLRPRFSESYTLSTRSDDGSRLFIDGVLVVGNWFDQAPTERSVTLSLDSSRSYDIVVEYYENSFGGEVQLFWQSASEPKQVIPQSALSPTRRLTTVRTFNGAGADTELSRVFPNDNGTNGSSGAFHSPAQGAFHQAAYWRLDLSSLNLSQNVIVDAVGTLSQTFFGIGDGKRQINIFGVRQSANGDNWVETGPGFVTWQTAAGNDGSGGQADATTSQFVSTYLLDNTGFQLNNQPDRLSFAGPRLLELLRADTDDRVTFLAKRVDASNEGQSWFTKEWGIPGFAPALKVELAPKCAQVLADPSVPSSVQRGDAVTLLARVRGLPPISYQWLRDGSAIVDGPGGANSGGGNVAGSSGTISTLAASTPIALTIAGSTRADNGVYTLRLIGSCGTITSAPASVVVVGACNPADIADNGSNPGPDGAVDNGDFSLFISQFFNAGVQSGCTGATIPCAAADIGDNGSNPGPDGFLDNGDFSLFISSFFGAVCP
jgi:hypothetical protein